MKRFACVLTLLSCLWGGFAIGFGVQGGASIDIMRTGDFDTGVSGDAALTLRLSETSPFVFGVGGYNSFRSFSLFADWWALNVPLGERFGLYAGVGVYGGLFVSPFSFEVGGRVPIGVNAFFLDNFIEGYVQAVPSVGFEFGDSGGLAVFAPINLGIRIYLGNMPDFGNLKADWNKGLGSLNALQSNIMQAAFSQVFARVFSVGGIYLDYNTLEEGQGVVWNHSYTDESEGLEYTTEVALLKKLDNGDSWWYIAMTDEGELLEYEGLLDSQLRVKRIRYSEDGKTKEYVFPVPTSASEEGGSLAGIDAYGGFSTLGMTFTMEALADFAQGTETVRVPAGTWRATKSVYEYGSSDQLISYNWYYTLEVPGQLIKYDHRHGDEMRSNGELQSVGRNYKTKFGSY